MTYASDIAVKYWGDHVMQMTEATSRSRQLWLYSLIELALDAQVRYECLQAEAYRHQDVRRDSRPDCHGPYSGTPELDREANRHGHQGTARRCDDSKVTRAKLLQYNPSNIVQGSSHQAQLDDTRNDTHVGK